jgi:imidazole glycerol-phosphate synthase subunit HisF
VLKKRLIGVVTVRNGWAVQSFGYRRYLPLGRVECLVENLDRWGVDEILVQTIDRSADERGPNLDLLGRLGRLGLETPLIYGGGIATADQAVRVIQAGADRVALDQALHRVPDEVRRMSARLGAQALIAAVPARFSNAECVLRHDYVSRQCLPFGNGVSELIADRVVSELMLIDWQNEGGVTGFEPGQLSALPCPPVPLIVFGGFSDPLTARRFLDLPAVAAVAVGNLFAYREHAYQTYKRSVASSLLRPPIHAGARPIEES